MSLKITRGDEPMEVKRIVLTIYSQPGLGKTSLSFTASKPILLDFDTGAYRASNRGDAVEVSAWRDVANITDADLAPYDTIVIDTVGKALEFLAADIIATKPGLGYGGALNQQGWGQLGVRFRAFMSHLKKMGKDVVLISHMDEKDDNGSLKERLKIQGGSKDLVLTDSDVIARISVANKERHLVFSPTETAFGKDPAGLDVVAMPDISTPEYRTFLADIIDRTKAKLNTLSEEQLARKGEIEWFLDTLPRCETPEDVNGIISRAKAAGRDAAKMLADRAKELGFEFDAKRHEYIDPNALDQAMNEEAANEDANTGEAAKARKAQLTNDKETAR